MIFIFFRLIIQLFIRKVFIVYRYSFAGMTDKEHIQADLNVHHTYQNLFGTGPNLIGMLHLPPVDKADVDIEEVLQKAYLDTQALLLGGIEFAILENDGDKNCIENLSYDFDRIHKNMAYIGKKITEEFPDLNLGVQVLNNYSGVANLAAEMGAKFLRLQFFLENRKDAHGRLIKATHEAVTTDNRKYGLCILADIDSKGSSPMDVDYELSDTLKWLQDEPHYIPDAVILTGKATDSAAPLVELNNNYHLIQGYHPGIAVLNGSGTNNQLIIDGLFENIDGAVVGSDLKEREGINNGYVSVEKVRSMVDITNT